MIRPALAELSDLEELLGTDIVGAAAQQAEARLRQASAIVRAYAGVTWLNDANELDGVPDDIPGVVAGMVERASQNPTGITQETAGPYSRSFGVDAAQRLYLTKNDKLVIGAATGKITGIGTLSTTRGPLETSSCYDDRPLYPEETLPGVEALLWPS